MDQRTRELFFSLIGQRVHGVYHFTLGYEVLDFYEPDEDLKVEDVIPDVGCILVHANEYLRQKLVEAGCAP
jgi:hypothetical protein